MFISIDADHPRAPGYRAQAVDPTVSRTVTAPVSETHTSITNTSTSPASTNDCLFGQRSPGR